MKVNVRTGRKQTKIIVYSVCTMILLLVAAFIPGMGASAKTDKVEIIKKNDNFTVKAEYGIGGMAFYDYPMQVSVNVESKDNFSGVLRLIPETGYSRDIGAYGKNITLAAGESKTYKMTINGPSDTGIVHLSLSDDNDKVVYEEKSTLEFTSTNQYAIVGVLSDDYSGVNYLNGAGIQYGTYMSTASTMEFTKDSFPEDSQVLGVVSYIVIDNFDTSSLSEKQLSVLKKWVKDGGVLILSLGSHYQNVLSGFNDDFISGTLGNISKKNLTWYGEEEPLKLDSVECMDFSLNDGELMTGFSDDGSAYSKSVGLGKVVVLSYALSMEPMSSYNRRTEVMSRLLAGAATKTIVDNQTSGAYNNQFDMGMSVISYLGETKGPSTVLYGLLLTVYVVLVGPVLYLILKKVNKREKIWIAIPVVSLLFTGIIYCTSFLYRVNKPLLNTFTVLKNYDESTYENVYSEVVCPGDKQYKLDISDNYGEFRYNINKYSYGIFSNNASAEKGEYDYMIMENNADNRLVLNSDSAFDTFDFMMGRTVTDKVGNITLNLDCTTTGFTGTVTNDTVYDLTDVVVTYENHVYRAGDMKKGETIEIVPERIFDTTGYGTFDNLLSNGSDKSYTYQQAQIDDNILQYMVKLEDYNVGHVWGTILSYKPDIINDKQVKKTGVAVIIDDFTDGYSDVSGVYLPSIDPFIVDSQGDYDGENGYMYGQDNVTVTYSFDEKTKIDELTVNQDIIENGKLANVYAFNMDTGNFERVFENSDTLNGAELKKYLSHGILQLKYEKQQDSDYYIPRISASGK